MYKVIIPISQWWKELTGLLVALISMFGIKIRAYKGNNLLNKIDMENTINKSQKEIIKYITKMEENLYKEIHRVEKNINDRINHL